MPWQMLTSPVEQWAVLPSFVVGEYLFIGLALMALWHAHRQVGARRRRHLTVWVGAIVAGTANDVIFMALPLVDNFWQAQATIMLTPRLPLYIPCVYVCFMYLPTVGVWRLGLPPLAGATASGLAAIVFYAPYDIIGAKFLWWTWHDTDRPIANRLLGVPIGSTIWVIVFVATFAYLVRRMLDRDECAPVKTCAAAVAVVAALTTALMVVQMTLFQQLDGGVPGVFSLVAVALSYVAVVIHGWRRRVSVERGRLDRLLRMAVWVYFTSLVAIISVFDPQTHVSESVHQTVGPCYVEATDIIGFQRYEFLCIDDFDEDFSFDCTPERPSEGARWYAVCGRPHTAFWLWLTAVLALAVTGMVAYGFMFGRTPQS